MSRPKLDLVTSLFIGLVVLCGIFYTSFGLTPSSFGFVLNQIGAPEEGPVFGTARPVRADEWAGATPYIQAAVRNGFQRVNETSFYREDLRCFYVVPLKDWSLIFKPEVWGFFVIAPANAFALYYAMLMCAFLVGYFLLFRQMALEPFVAASAGLLLYFSGFTQFWWTSFGSLIAGLPWILLILFSQIRWWLKALLFSWVIPVVVFSFVYPTFFAEFAFAGIVMTIVVRPSLFRSPRDLAAIAIGGLVTGVVFYLYYRDLIPILSNTWYPGKRISPSGTMALTAVFSEIFPFLSFVLGDYRHLSGGNICEIAAVGSLLPLLTVCLMPSKLPKLDRSALHGLIALLAAIALILFWQITPAPMWIGRLLLWNHGDPQRLLYISGFLITVACLVIWREKLLQPDPRRIALFVAVGPVLSVVFKMVRFHLGLADLTGDLGLCGLGVAAGVLACMIPVAARLPLLLGAVTLMNVIAFGRFNPLQPGEPIFEVPETTVMTQLRNTEASTPGKYLLDERFFGGALNGMGFRSVNHVLTSPALSVFRQYFPTMDAKQFDFLFNRYAYIQLTLDAVPQLNLPMVIFVPIHAFEPALNIRTLKLETNPKKDCTIQRGGGIDHVSAQANHITIEGWAPWKGEEAEQELRVISARSLRAGPLSTVRRPDISETMKDYIYTRAGFKLELSSTDGRPVNADEVVLVARGTSQGIAQLSGCGCP